MNLLKFIFSKIFLVNLFIAVIIFFLIFYGTNFYLKKYTLHNKTITVPNLKGIDFYKAKELLKKENLELFIMDSIYVKDKKGGTILEQNPEGGSFVKKNRKIYVTICSKKPPKVSVPNLKDMSLRQAKAILESYGLKVGELSFKPDECVNCVLEQLINGKKIQPGTFVTKGSKIDLLLGQGLSEEKTIVPNLIGMRIDIAKEKIMAASLNVGAELYDNSKIKNKYDSINAFVYKQIPSYSENKYINLGSSIDLYLTTDSNKLKK